MTAKELADLWEPLAARCPELRPELPTGPHRQTAALAAALWRDAAVRWLAERNWEITINAAKGHGDEFEVCRNPGEDVPLGSGPTLDHALAAAVRAVLDAKP